MSNKTMLRGEVLARVYPTQVVAFIERMFPGGMEQPPEKIRGWRFGHTYAEQLAALIEKVDLESSRS